MRLEIALPQAIINRYPNGTCFAFKDTIVLLKSEVWEIMLLVVLRLTTEDRIAGTLVSCFQQK